MDALGINVREPAEFKTEVLVIGGGPAGCMAAISAARNGRDTILVEENGFCGGMATAGLVGPFMTCYDRTGEEMVVRGLFEELVNRLVERHGAIHPSCIRAGTPYVSWIEEGHDHCTPFDAEKMKKLLEEMLIESGVHLLYHTVFIETLMRGNLVEGAVVKTRSGIKKIRTGVVIDCTGDGNAAVSAGAEFVSGNGENAVQPASMFFRICNVDSERLEADIEAHRHLFRRENGVAYRCFHWLVDEAKKRGEWHINRASIGLYKGVAPDEWCVNTSRVLGVDSTDSLSLTAGEVEGRRQVEEIMQFLHKYVPGCENVKLMASGSTLGIRESRHICGDYWMKAEDIIDGRIPPDTIAVCSNSVDVHGKLGPNTTEYITMKQGRYYGIPYRSLLVKGIEGMLVAGRCLSADYKAAGAVRVMPPCMAMGQAAGTAAAISVRDESTPRALDPEKVRTQLRKDGAFLP